METAARRRKASEALAAAGGQYEATVEGLRAREYPAQAACVSDLHRLIAVLGTRRSGKSSSWLRKMLYDAKHVPDSYQIYINTTEKECKRIAWRGANPKDGLLALNKAYDLGGIVNKSELTLTFPDNNAVIELVPADDVKGIERAVGTAPHRIFLDEAQKMPHLEYMLQEILGPGLEDFDGQFIQAGTAHRNCSGLFFELTNVIFNEDGTITCEHKDPDNCVHAHWGIHKLSIFDNPWFQAKPGGAMGVVERYCARFNLSMDDPEIRRIWFGEWVLQDANFCYPVHAVDEDTLIYAPARWVEPPKHLPPYGTPDGGVPDIPASIADLPEESEGNPYTWLFGCAIDLGYEPDPFGMHVCAWTPELPDLFELFSWKQLRLTTDEQIGRVLAFASHPRVEYRIAFSVADAGGLGKLIVKSWIAQLQERFPIPLEAAEKSDKAGAMTLMGNDIRAGRYHMRSGSPLLSEMRKLTWSKPNALGKRVENVQRDGNGTKRAPNDLCDPALYAHRRARHHTHVPEAPPVDREEFIRREEEELEAAANDRAQVLRSISAGEGWEGW